MLSDRGGGVVALAAALLVVGAALPAVVPGAAAGGTATVGGGAAGVVQEGAPLPADQTAIRIRVRPDGTAVWTVQYRVELDDPNRTAAFESVRQRIEADPLRFTGPFAEKMSEAAAVAATDTGREMAVRNVTVRARELPNGFGVVSYRFEWTGFASTAGGRMVVGDALVGFFLPEGTTLVLQWPASYEVERVVPSPDERRDRAAVWRGPTEFAPAEPRVVLAGGGGIPTTAGAAAALLLVLAGAGAVVYRRRSGGSLDDGATTAGEDVDGSVAGEAAASDETAGGTGGGASPDGTTAGEAAGASGDGPDAEPAAGEAAPAAGAAAAGAAATAGAGGDDGEDEDGDSEDDEDTPDDEDTGDEVPEELLSDAERVLGLVEERGGRMKQQEVVSALDWSETKTSEVVNDLREEGKLEVYRLGRENVLALPGEMDV